MANPPRVALRVGVALAFVAVASIEVVSLVQGVYSVRRLRARITHNLERRLSDLRPLIAPILKRRAAGDWSAIAALRERLGTGSEVAVLGAHGRVLFSDPRVETVTDLLQPEHRQRLQRGGLVVLTARDRGAVRVVGYLTVTQAGSPLLLRVAAPAGDLEDEMREYQQSLLGHLASLTALAAAALVVLRGIRGGTSEPASALHAYEEAMERLRDHGEQVEARHEAERRRMEDVIRETEAMARAGELTAGIVHEVRNGLGTIVGYARMLEKAGLRDDPAIAARSIREEGEALEAVIRRFTDFIRVEELHLAPTDVVLLLERVVARETRGHRGVSLRFARPESPLRCQADEEMLERAIENLVRNAVTAAEGGGGNVDIGAERDEQELRLTIEDDGPGLAPDHPGEVRPFYSTRPGGLGLGLPLARKVVLLHAGILRLEPREPHGLAVTVVLPIDGPSVEARY